MRYFFGILFLAGVCFAQPNVILFVADDQGAETARPYGGDWATPNIDNIRTNGMMFSNAHGCESCAPARATLLTGRYSHLLNRFDPIVTYPLMMAGTMSTDEVTIADVLGDAGYSTCVVGKWNLYFGTADDTEANRQTQLTHIQSLGFDTNYTFIGHTIQYWGDTNTFWGSDAGYVESNYFPHLAYQFATNWISNATEPFYLQYSFGLPHQPYEVTPDNLSQTNETDAVKVAGMYTYMDGIVGDVLTWVDTLGLTSNTVVIYVGDNGTDPALTNSYNSIDISGGKLTSDETGDWIPMYWKWPGVIQTNSTYTGLTSFVDVLPTLSDLCDGNLPDVDIFDGRSFYSGLLGNSSSHRRTYCRCGWQHSHRMYADTEYKYSAYSDKLYSIVNKPYGDAEIISPNIFQTVKKYQLKQEYFIETNKTTQIHPNERFFAL